MKSRIETYKIFLIAETPEERNVLHELRVRGGVRGMQMHRCMEPDSCLELHVLGGPMTPPEPSAKLTETPQVEIERLLAELRQCAGLIQRFLD
mgnify:FL=1